MDTKAQGAWIIHHAGKLEEYGTSAGMDNLRKAGNCGVLLSALSASDEQNQLSNEKVRTLAEVAGLDLTYQLPALLETLKDHALIDLGQNSIEVLGLTTRTVLEHTGNIFNHLDPKPIEIASLDAAELCSQAPRTDVELGKYLSNQYHLSELFRNVPILNSMKMSPPRFALP